MNYTSEIELAIVKFSVPFYAILILSEVLFSNYYNKKLYSISDFFTNIFFTSLNATIDLFFRGIYFFILVWFYGFHMFTIENPYIYWITLFVFQDFAYYTLHYVDHYSRFFWAAHVTHHSSELFNISTGFRSSIFQPLYRFVYFIPIAILGFHPIDILLMYSITQFYGVMIHTEAVRSFGWLNKVLVDPSHHRVHHASNPMYLDKNMGMCLIIFDKIFGTYQAELKSEPVVYGLTKNEDNKSIINSIFHEYIAIIKDSRNAPNFKSKISYVFKAPGWSHDGSTLTSEQMRTEDKKISKL